MSEAGAIIRSCVHCGFCTATCPTYVLLGDERDSPRGRIQLIRTMLGSDEAPTPATVRHLDRCLSCLACTTTCPADVDYGHLIDAARVHVEGHHRRAWHDRWLRDLLAALLPRPRIFAPLLALGRVGAPLLRRLPGRLGALGQLAALAKPGAPRLPARSGPADAAAQVLLLTGCVQDVAGREIHQATARLLGRMGIVTLAPAAAGCCGALTLHMGKRAAAEDHARRLIDVWTPHLGAIDAIVIDASGCGTAIKDYGRLLAGDPAYAARAAQVAALGCDITEYVARRGLPPVIAGDRPTLAYHPPCSLQHGQKWRDPPAELLRAAGFAVRPLAESHICCGSAGVYNILQPEIAGALRTRKLAAIAASGARVVATGNLGCALQLAGDRPVVHTVELLDWATGGPRPAGLISAPPR